MPVVHLDDRALVTVAGPDAEHFLQNLITTDLSGLKAGAAKAGALLTPQGKILFDFLVMRRGEGFVLDCRADIADELVKRLTLYKLRAKVEIGVENPELVAISFGDESAPSHSDSAFADRRFPPDASVFRLYGDLPAASSAIEAWTAFRAANGVAESGLDFALGDAFPHDVLYDQNDGVGLKKGCYVGQEVVSRMHHRGTARRRLMIVATGNGALPAPGSEVSAGGRAIGTMGSGAAGKGLAIVRVDRVAKAVQEGIEISAEGIPLTLERPAWASYPVAFDGAEEPGA